MNGLSESRRLYTYINVTLSLLALLAGGFLYAIFRSDGAYMFNWFGNIGMVDYIYNLRDSIGAYPIESWVRYNLPASLWLLAYLFAIAAIWTGHKTSRWFYFFVWLMTFMALATEILQLFEIIPGTFDVTDVLSYAIVTLVFFIINKYI